MIRRLVVLGQIVVIAVACVTPTPSRSLPPQGRACVDLVEYPADTVVSLRSRHDLGIQQLSRDGPRYPDMMRVRHVEGSVRASFVIDSMGNVAKGTAVITNDSDRAFGDAVCTWLVKVARFEPLIIGGRRYSVRIVDFPVEFTLERASP